jgi:hypothetical protein
MKRDAPPTLSSYPASTGKEKRRCHPTIWALDVHKVRSQYCPMDPGGELLLEDNVPTEEFASLVLDPDSAIVLEARGAGTSPTTPSSPPVPRSSSATPQRERDRVRARRLPCLVTLGLPRGGT